MTRSTYGRVGGPAGHSPTSPHLTLILLLLGILASSASAADGRVITGREYFQTVREAIEEADTSIDILMYFIIAPPDRPEHPVVQLVNGLIAAHQRGVKVRVILEDSKFRENYYAYGTLTSGGVEVGFDTPGSLLHTKAIVIDGKTCIVGSANWSRAAFENNHELSVLINSEEQARKILKSFSKIQLRDHVPILARPVKGVEIPAGLLAAGGAFSRMVGDRAGYAFEMYLLLLRKAHQSGHRTIPFDTAEFKDTLGARNVRRPRLRLQRRYRLIEYDSEKKEITLTDAHANSPSFVLPYEYWEYGLNRTLSLRARFMYLAGLKEASKSTRNPYWFRSQKDLAEIYGISDYTVSLGLQELERENIVEIERSEAPRRGEHSDRRANVYCMNQLMSPAEFEKRMAGLAERYADRAIKQAQELSAELNEPKDPLDIETFAQLIKQHGYEAVKAMNDITAGMKKGSGRRDIETTRNLLTNIP